MTYNEWLTSYTTLTSKVKRKKPLTAEEIDDLLEVIENIRNFTNEMLYEVIKKQ